MLAASYNFQSKVKPVADYAESSNWLSFSS